MFNVTHTLLFEATIQGQPKLSFSLLVNAVNFNYFYYISITYN